MDFAFLNASMIASTFPPMDPWLSGHGISYYYFGYLTMGLPGVLAGIPSGVVYNLALALLPAMAAMGAVSLVCAVALRMGARLKTAFGVGLLAALMLGFLGNLEGVFEMLRAWGGGSDGFWQSVGIKGLDASNAGASFFPSDHWWWWRSSRVIDTVVAGVSLDPTIHEYPFFSWFLGDLHPHVMSIPFVLLFVAFSFSLFSDDTLLSGASGGGGAGRLLRRWGCRWARWASSTRGTCRCSSPSARGRRCCGPTAPLARGRAAALRGRRELQSRCSCWPSCRTCPTTSGPSPGR